MKDGTKSKTVEYLVKWKGWAHIHNSWDTEQYLKDFHGFKKVLNYNKIFMPPEGFGE